jgi:solute carrier family 25 protein 39/40
VTPFDVLKTRLQTVQPDPFKTAPPPTPSADCCQTSLLTPRRAPPGKKNPFTCFTSVDEFPVSRRGARAKFSSLTATLPASAPSGCSFPSKWAGIWGEAVTLEEALKRIKNGGGSLSTVVLPRQKAGFWSEVATIRTEVGVRGLWKGVGTTL